MNVKSSPAVAQLGKFRSKLVASEAEGIKGQLNQIGINMVDLMMWLVIAALLLAAALQGIGYYQQAAWTYQAKSDVSSVRTYMEAQFTLNNNAYPNNAAAQASIASGDLKLTGTGANANTLAVTTPAGTQGWTATLRSAPLGGAGKPDLFNFTSTGDNNVGATGAANAPLPAGV